MPDIQLRYGLTQNEKDVEWFDNWEDALESHWTKSPKFEWHFVVYGMAERICNINWHPGMGYFVTGFVHSTENGDEDRFAKWGLTEHAIFGEEG